MLGDSTFRGSESEENGPASLDPAQYPACAKTAMRTYYRQEPECSTDSPETVMSRPVSLMVTVRC